MPAAVEKPTAIAHAVAPAAQVTIDMAQIKQPEQPEQGDQADQAACAMPGCNGQACRVSGCPPKRWLFAGLGSVCFGIAAAGVVLPVVPTTFPLMLSVLFFARSSPMLERKVREFSLFRPYIRYIDGSTPMPLRAKIVSCALMWTPVSLTAWMLANHTDAPPAAWIGTLMLAVVGTPFILFWRPRLIG
ncbi:MAG: YbaN family protein [Planctomycetota bacterium]